MWDSLGEILRVLIFSVAHVCAGSLGSGVILVSTGIRLALLPLSLRAARHARAQQAKLLALKPRLDMLQRRHASDPARLFTETRKLQAEHGIRLMPGGGVLSLLIQLPVLGALFTALRGFGARVPFLWIADLARPDALVVAAVAGLTALGVATAPLAPGQAAMPRGMTIIATIGTVAFLWSASSAFALSVGAGSVVSMVQNLVLAREAKQQAAV